MENRLRIFEPHLLSELLKRRVFSNIDSRTAFRTKIPPKSRRFRGLSMCSLNVRFLNAKARADPINYKANSPMSFLLTNDSQAQNSESC